MDFHLAVERVRDMPFGKPAWEQLLLILSRTTQLHSKDATHHWESTHRDEASDEHFVQRIQQHNVGVGQDELAPDPALNDREPKSWGLLHDKGNAYFGRDIVTERYNYGTVRPATATGDSVEDDPSYVPVTDDELDTGEFNVYMPSYQPFEDGDRVMYVLQKDGTAWTFGGGTGAQLRKATADSNWVDDSPPYVDCTDTESGATVRVLLPRTMPGDPNVRGGATLYYMIANDGNPICMTPYMDDEIGTMKVYNADGDPYDGWEHHLPSEGRVVPNYKPGDDDYPTTGTAGGNKEHTHDDHVLSMTGVEVVTGFDSETCEATTTQLCFLGSTV